ncbi:MAG TPA: endonuclease V, partial [bacterium]|nr:endonuclease V [bacterium]
GDIHGWAGIVVMRLLELTIIEQHCRCAPLTFPYVPGLLSFRELPLLLPLFAELQQVPDAVICDGQGRAHPRRFGLACHLGLWLDLPTVGCAKSILCGSHAPLQPAAGSMVPLTLADEEIGTVLRTRAKIKPVYVSVGHRITLPDAVRLVQVCCTRYRLPEPIRAAHALVNRARITHCRTDN